MVQPSLAQEDTASDTTQTSLGQGFFGSTWLLHDPQETKTAPTASQATNHSWSTLPTTDIFSDCDSEVIFSFWFLRRADFTQSWTLFFFYFFLLVIKMISLYLVKKTTERPPKKKKRSRLKTTLLFLIYFMLRTLYA
jgi:hypothetical protein